jgi:hypothetical protein
MTIAEPRPARVLDMRHPSWPMRLRSIRQHCVLLCTAAFSAVATAQNTPLISGGIGFFSDTNAGVNTLQPVVAPVLAAPLGKYLLVESRGDIRESSTNGAHNVYQGEFVASLVFLQIDYVATSRLTIVGGHFLTPFGTYNERLSPIWIPNFQNAPLIYGIGTRTSGDGDGGMLRGALTAQENLQINYTAYFSAASTVHDLKAARTAGGQAALCLPRHRLEAGYSVQRFLEGTHLTSQGADLWWLPYRVPLEVRSEFAHAPTSEGYWVEAAYPLSQLRGPHSFLADIQPVLRMQQTYRIKPNFPGQGDALPATNTQEADFGLDYVARGSVRLNSSYARSFSAAGNKNIWDTSLTYRFMFPAWKERK